LKELAFGAAQDFDLIHSVKDAFGSPLARLNPGNALKPDRRYGEAQ